MDFALIIPAFVAGVLTFLAPCTLPLVPGYLAFISGSSVLDFNDPNKVKMLKSKVIKNGVMYVIGFSVVFIILGSLFGLGGSALIQYRVWLSRIGGIFVIIFGLYMMHVFKLKFLDFLGNEKRFNFASKFEPGKSSTSFILGATFAFGWTPCVGPILGSVLLLASTSATVLQGAFLLAVFSAGLGIPFLLIAFGIGSASKYLHRISKYLKTISFIGGLFLLFIGILLLTNSFGLWLGYFYSIFSFVNYEALLDYL